MTALQELAPDLSVVDSETGQVRVLVEAKHSASASAVGQLADYMQVAGAQGAILLTVDRSVLLLPGIGTPGGVELHEVPTDELLGATPEGATESELLDRAKRAIEDWIRSIDRGATDVIPRALVPYFVWPLHHGLVLVEEYHGSRPRGLC